MKFTNVKVISMDNWDAEVIKTYGRPYVFQQQYDCRSRGTFEFTVPNKDLAKENDEGMNESIPESLDIEEMGVKFSTWLARDPQQPLSGKNYDWELSLWWSRNFYPDPIVVAQDMYERGLLEAGDYMIVVDW
jgi:hypothetical protein